MNIFLNVVTRRAVKNQVQYKFGVCVLRTYEDALNLDKENGKSLWQEAVHWELDQILSYKSFCSIGIGGNPGPE